MPDDGAGLVYREVWSVGINSGLEMLEARPVAARVADRQFCAAETTSGSTCRAAPKGNGRCVQHGGQTPPSVARDAEDDATIGFGDGLSPTVRQTLDRTTRGVNALAAGVWSLSLAERQRLVPELRVVAGTALALYNELLAENRKEAAAKFGRVPSG